MAKGRFVSYLRVSTDKQGRSGLGLEAQRAAVEGYLNGGKWTLAAEYVEAESGKRNDRPKLEKALAHAKAIGATIVFAKLDRLTRNVDLLRKLVGSDVDLVFCDLPHVPPGAMGRFLLTQMASVAELEAGLISERTKAALAAAKARGVKLGNPNGARALRGKQVGNDEAIKINAWLKEADIAFDKAAARHGVVDPTLLHSIDHVDPSVRQLRRYFSRGSFESGGRLFGAFWQNLERQARLRGLRINGEGVVSLDYSQFNPLLAYSIAGQMPPLGDAYTLPGLERNRERVKRVFNSMMFSTTPLRKFPKGVRAQSRLGEVTTDNEPFPAQIRIEDVTGAIISKHPGLSTLFYKGTGHQMMFQESQIMMAVLLTLNEKGVVALPVFDAVVVKETDEVQARAVMMEQFQGRTGLTASIKREMATSP